MANLYSLVPGLLERPFSELFLSDALLWNQYKFITFNTFSCKMLLISCKILTSIAMPNEKTNELTILARLCRNVTIFYRQEISYLL